MQVDAGLLSLALISVVAATVTGALGYGFSSLTVPVALIFHTGRVLNPALVLVEAGVNLYALVLNRRRVGALWPRLSPMVVGLVPGVTVGSLLLSRVDPGWMKLLTLGVLLPLILLQAAGIRWPIRNERVAGVPLGAGVGVLYSVTTISGPPLALLFNNQGMGKEEFRAALALMRTAESFLTIGAYAALGLFTSQSTGLVPWLIPGVLVGMPLGHWVIRALDADTFRRLCVSFDAWVVAFGLSRLIVSLQLLSPLWAYQVLTAVVVVDAMLLHAFFTSRRATQALKTVP